MTNINEQEQFIELRAKGLSFAKISEELGVSKPTLIKWSNEFEVDIQNMRAIEQEALREKYLITREKRLAHLSNSLDKVNQEMGKRDLSEITTEKLFYLNSKLLQDMKAEEISSLVFVRKGSSLEIDFSETQTWNA